MTRRWAAGIDVGGTNTAFGLVDDAGHVERRASVRTREHSTPGSFVDAVSAAIAAAVAGAGELIGVGVGAPNGNYFSGSIEFAPNLPWKGVIPLARMFSERLHVRTVLTNDANAAALGEMRFGAARDMRDFILITLGTGVGSGIVSNGELVYGHDGFAGEIGHVIVVPGGRACGCGRRGCLEMYASAGGLVTTYRELAARTPPGTTADDVTTRARAGDGDALEAFRRTGELLGLTLANSVAHTSPRAIFLFGGVVAAGELLLAPTRAAFDANLLNIYRGEVDLRVSGLPENDAALLGAASLVWA